MKRSIIHPLLPLLVLALAPLVSPAQPSPNPPGQISYQGFLTDASGIPLATNAPKNYTVIFRIWDASTAGNNLWAEQQVVTVDRGYFTVMLGNGTSIGAFFTNDLSGLFSGPGASDRYLGMTVNELSANEIAPRLRLLASPYAFLASKAVAATTASSVDGGAVTGTVPDARLSANVALRAGGNALTGTQTITSGSLGVGTASPLGKLDISGGDLFLRGGNIYMDNSKTFAAKNMAGSYEYFLWPRASDNSTLLNYGTRGFYIRNNASSTTMALQDNGDVGIGTASPQAKLDVAGDIKADGDIQANAGIAAKSVVVGEEKLRIVRGYVPYTSTSSGSGTGYTWTEKDVVGDIVITFTPVFTGIPVVTGTAVVKYGGGTDLYVVMIKSAANDQYRLSLRNNQGGTLEKRDFTFIAIGPR